MTLETILTARQLADSLRVPLPEGVADAYQPFEGVGPLESATKAQVSFAATDELAATAAASKAGLILCPQKGAEKFAAAFAAAGSKSVALPVPNVWSALIHVLNFFHPEPPVEGKIHPAANIDPSARLADLVDVGAGATIEADAIVSADCAIGAGAYVGQGVQIGRGTRVAPNAYLHAGTIVGARCVIGPNASIGWSGFKYEKVNGAATYIPQVGRVVIEDDVHIGANSSIDRAGFHETRIGARTKIDNLVQIGHNVIVGPDCILCAQAGVAGSSRLGRGAILAGQAGVADHLTLGDGVVLLAQAGAANDLEKAGMYFGAPCEPHREYFRKRALVGQLADMKKRLAALEKADAGEGSSLGDEKA